MASMGMTESEAWALIATAEIHPLEKPNSRAAFYLHLPGVEDVRPHISGYGLCYLIGEMEACDISVETAMSMRRKIDDELERHYAVDPGAVYLFPRTQEGQQQRLAFARRMAEETK